MRGYTDRPQVEDYVAFLVEGGARWHRTCGQQAVVSLENQVWDDAPERLDYCMRCCLSIHPEYAVRVVSEEPFDVSNQG